MHWIVHLEGGPQRVNHAAVAVGNTIYSFGGYCSNEGYESTRKIDVHVLDTETLRWFPVYAGWNNNEDDIPFYRYGHTVVANGRQIYLWGGRNDLGSSNVLHCFDVVERQWTVPQVHGQKPPATDGHSACIIGSFMYLFGGFEDEAETYSQELYRLNFATMTWEKVKTFGIAPQCRDFHSASAIGSNMYIFGGRAFASLNNQVDDEYYCNLMMYLDTTTMTWVTPLSFGIAPSGRRSHSAVVYKDELYVIGGFNGITSQHMADIHKYNPVNNNWWKVEVLGNGPCARRRHCCCVVGDKLYLFGGTSPVNTHQGQKSYLYYNNSVSLDNSPLMDHSDLHVMEFSLSLKRLCQMRIIKYNMDYSILPISLQTEIVAMTQDNMIQKPVSMEVES